MSTTLRTSKLIDLCTPSISYDAQVKSACAAFDRQMYEIIDDMNGLGVTDPIGDQPSFPKQGIIMIPTIMDIFDSNLIDILAWQFHVDFYDPTRDLEFRKNLVQKAITWHMRKGTVDLVQEVLDTYWKGGATLLEWFEYMSPLPPNAPNPNPGMERGLAWHDRYRFRIYIDETIIDPDDEAKVLELIDRYKPISRWPEGIFRATNSEGKIGWCGMMLRFIIYTSEEPTEHREAESYHFQGPASGAAAVDSEFFGVSLPTLTSVSDVVIVTPNDGGAGGTFSPTEIKLTTANPTGKFTYIPASVGTKTINVTNNSGLADPPAVTYAVKPVAVTYLLSGPASGYTGTASTPFTVALPAGTISSDVTITPNDGGAGGTFSPASLVLNATLLRRKAETPSATFTYTPPA